MVLLFSILKENHVNPKFLYHYTTSETLAIIKKTKKLRASVLENFLIKNNADKEELKHGLNIMAELICDYVFKNYEIEEVDKLKFKQKLLASIDFQTVYNLSISSSDGKWIILSLTENPDNEYLNFEYSKGMNTKIKIRETFIKKLPAENLIKVNYCDSIGNLSDTKISDANDIADLYCKLEDCKQITPEEDWKDLHSEFLLKVLRFAFAIKHTKFEKEEEVRFVMLLSTEMISVENEEKYHYFFLEDEDFEINL